MIFREALISDIPPMQVVRNSVKENTLSDPALVKDEDYVTFMLEQGKGWVCEWDGTIVGFAIVDLAGHNIWALFVLPNMEGKGIGGQLQRLMLDWYFSQTQQTIWLGTSPKTKAELFYRNSGWKAVGMHGSKEIKFEMSWQDWAERSSKLVQV